MIRSVLRSRLVSVFLDGSEFSVYLKFLIKVFQQRNLEACMQKYKVFSDTLKCLSCFFSSSPSYLLWNYSPPSFLRWKRWKFLVKQNLFLLLLETLIKQGTAEKSGLKLNQTWAVAKKFSEGSLITSPIWGWLKWLS